MNILVIEDSRFLRVAIERVLAKAGHSVTGVAAMGAKACRRPAQAFRRSFFWT
jgi:DNA-binding response OmpR family regulator